MNVKKIAAPKLKLSLAVVFVACLGVAVPGDNGPIAQAEGDGATPAVGDNDGAVDRDLARFRGNWICYSAEVGGQKLTVDLEGDEFDALHSPIFRGDTWSEAEPDGKPPKLFYKLRLNPSTSPKSIDLVRDDVGETLRGIYLIERDTLVICLNGEKRQTQRPTRFRTEENTPLVLMFYERKPAPAKALVTPP